jgi:hypothetical protein
MNEGIERDCIIIASKRGEGEGERESKSLEGLSIKGGGENDGSGC